MESTRDQISYNKKSESKPTSSNASQVSLPLVTCAYRLSPRRQNKNKTKTNLEQNELGGPKWVHVLQRDGRNDRRYEPTPQHVEITAKRVKFCEAELSATKGSKQTN